MVFSFEKEVLSSLAGRTNISNKTSVKLRPLVDDTSVLVTDKNINEVTSNLDAINSIISWFNKNRLIMINKGKSLALGFHHKLNKTNVFPDKILKV
jgi:hypothetical protein